jgi:hypothetical protein
MRRVVLLVFLALFSLPLCAQQSVAEIAAQAKAAHALPANAPTRSQVLTLFDLLQVRRNMVVAMDGMKKAAQEGAAQSFRERVPDPTPKQLELLNKMMEDMFGDMPLDEIVDAIVPVYQSHLTKSDIEEIIRFYSSPVGQKLLREQPQMMQEGMKAAAEVQQKRMQIISQKMDQRMQELVDASQEKSPAPKK